jgi:outer membrane lipoprotein-sorting protein
VSGNLRFCLISLALVFSFLMACDKKSEKAVSVLKRLETNYKSLKSFRADITMERFNSQLGENDCYNGKFIYLRQGKDSPLVRIDWTKPTEESLTIVNREYTLYRPRLQQSLVGKIDQPEVASALKDGLDFLNKSKAELKADLTFKYLGKQKLTNGILTEHLEFTSKSAKNYKKIEFWTDKSGMLIQFKIFLNNNDSITISLTNIEKNKNIAPEIFKINLPKNTKIVRG